MSHPHPLPLPRKLRRIVIRAAFALPLLSPTTPPKMVPSKDQALAKGCTELQTLVLDGCFQVSKTALRAVGGGLHSLRRLSLARCPSLALEGVSSVAKGCPSLTDLNLS